MWVAGRITRAEEVQSASRTCVRNGKAADTTVDLHGVEARASYLGGGRLILFIPGSAEVVHIVPDALYATSKDQSQRSAAHSAM